MEDTRSEQAEQIHTPETSGTQRPASEVRSDFEELKETSQHFFNTLVRVGIHLATTPVSSLPEEPREHFAKAFGEFTRGLSTLAHELANTVEKVSEEMNLHEQKDAEKNVR